MTRDAPCGNCDAGIYSELAMLNKKARKFGAMEEKERERNIPMCKKESHLKCAGCTDFHNMLKQVDNL